MELLVLSTLKWRMQAITPFTFLDYFLCKINDDQSPLRSSIMRSIQLISSTARGTYIFFLPNFIAQMDCFLNVAHLCSDNNSEWVELVMVIWVVWVQCRDWLLGIQTIRDCSSSGYVCHGGNPNSWRWESNFFSDSTRRKGKDGGPITRLKKIHGFYFVTLWSFFSWLLLIDDKCWWWLFSV